MKFINLNEPHRYLKEKIYRAINDVFQKSDFILGEDVRMFEKEFAAYCKAKYGVGVASGTDALFLSLKSLGIKEGDEVIVPVFTFIATAFAVTYTGARCVFVDINPATFCLDAEKIEKAITERTKAIIVVHLFGHPADMDAVMALAKRYNVKVIEDAAQAHGAVCTYRGIRKQVGTIGDTGCFSFYPTKNLAACGDAGAVVTQNKNIYNKLLLLRDCGRVSRYKHKVVGYNSRLDSIQAGILRVKLKKINFWNKLRRQKAHLYSKLLSSVTDIIVPHEDNDLRHVFHLYVIKVKNRDKLTRRLSKYRIPFAIHYPIPLHLQPAYRSLGYKKSDFPVAEEVCQRIISLPLHPYLQDEEIKRVVKVIKNG